MAVIVTFEVRSKADKQQQMLEFLRGILPDTRAYQGCQGLTLLVDQDQPTSFVVHEQWDTRGHYEHYLAWRHSSGTVAAIAELLDGQPLVRYFDAAATYP